MPEYTEEQILLAVAAIVSLQKYILASDAYIYGQIFSDLPNLLKKHSHGNGLISCYSVKVAIACHDFVKAAGDHCGMLP